MIIDDIRINQNYGKEEKKSSFIVTETRNWHHYESKIVSPAGEEHLPGNIVFQAATWLKLAKINNLEYFDCDGNPQDLDEVGKAFMEFIQEYFKI